MMGRGVLNKRGQVTLFIIIGILIVLVVVIGIFIRNYIQEGSILPLQQESILIPVQARPVYNFVDSCVQETGLEAIRILGLQGGYINLPPDALINAPGNRFSNALSLFNGFNVPYWYYEKASGIQTSNVPTLEQMEQEINDYVELNLEDCVTGLSVFGDQGYTIEVGIPNVDVDIQDDSVVINVNYDMDLNLKGSEFKLENFRTVVPVELGRYYDVATDIIRAENQHTFLENYTLDAMIVYEDIPFDTVDFECAPKIWSTTEVEKDFRRAMSLNIPSIKLVGTEYDISESSREYFEQDVLTENVRGLTVNFLYSENWPFFMEVLQDENGILKGQSVTRPLTESSAKLAATFFCMNAYHFVYDVKYPVLITIRDESALDGQGYTFQYAIQVIIDNNQPRENRILTEEILLEDPSICTRSSVENTVFVSTFDRFDNLVPIEGAGVEYKCLTTICPIGETLRDEFGQASLTSAFPPCVNGQVIARKEGFFEGKTQLSSNNGEVVSVVLDPIYNKKFKVKVIDPRQGIRDPFETEQVVFSLHNGDYSSSFVYPSGLSNIKLIPGEYEVSSIMIRESERGIRLEGSSNTKCFEVPKKGIGGILGQKEEECVPIEIDGIDVNQLIVGGAEFNWNVDILQLSENNEVVFYTYYNGFPSTVEGMNNIYNQIVDNNKKLGFRLPEFE